MNSIQLDIAEEVAEKALQIDPNDLNFVDLKASIYERQGLDDKAIECALIVLAAETNNVEVLYTLGSAYLNSDQFDETLKVAHRILAIDPENEIGLEHKRFAELGINREKVKKRKKMDSEHTDFE